MVGHIKDTAYYQKSQAKEEMLEQIMQYGKIMKLSAGQKVSSQKKWVVHSEK